MQPSTVAELALEAERGNKLALGRLITRIETSHVDRSQVSALMLRRRRGGHIVGFFGPPGVGKSSLIGSLISAIRARDESVAVLATDPTSPVSRGAILGDRIRMQSTMADPGVFIRSLASRDPSLSLSAITAGAAYLLATIRYDYVLLETVGIGQADLGTTLIADTNVLVLMPGTGDEVQGMKAGVMELPDIFVLNKADLPNSQHSLPVLRHAARSIATEHPKWSPPVVALSAASGEGVSLLLEAIAAHRRALESNGGAAAGREKTAHLLLELAVTQLAAALRERIPREPHFTELVAAVLAGEIDLYAAADLAVARHLSSEAPVREPEWREPSSIGER